MELRNDKGTLIASVKTQSGGSYSFGPAGLAAAKNYIVHPVVDRGQSANPMHVSIRQLPATGAGADFSIRGVPATITVYAKPGTFVLLKPGSGYGSGYLGTTPLLPPTIKVGSSDYYSSVVGTGGSVKIQVPGNFSYYLTCWSSQRTNTSTSYQVNNTTPTAVNEGALIMPTDTAAHVYCPTQ